MTLPRRTQLALLLSATLPLAACETLTASGGTDLPPEVDPALVACKAFAPIYWSAEDSDETILAIKQYNAAWLAICPAPEATP